MSLFLRFFLFLWLMAALLAVSFFALGRLSGSEAIEHALEVLNARAETVSGLIRQDGWREARQWFRQQPAGSSLHLLDENGSNPFARRRHGPHRLMPELVTPLKPGAHRQLSGLIVLVAPLPDIEPPLFLVQQLAPGQVQRMPLWTLLLAALLIISVISYLLASLLSRRIVLLRHAVQGIADGNLSTRVEISGKDEIGQLASTFNRMADKVEDMLQSQRQLVRDVSHELRSPLARLRIALELAERNGTDPEALKRIEKEGDELEKLVTSLLSLSRIESGQSQLEQQPVDINKLVEALARDANFEGAEKDIEVVIGDIDAVMLQADPVLLRSALENVIRNAIRHSPPGSRIDINAQRQDTCHQVSIDDNGPGVPEHELEHIFQPFSRVSASRDRDSGGFGLGLAISAQALQIHGGKISAENRPGGGLRVTLSLPLNLVS